MFLLSISLPSLPKHVINTNSCSHSWGIAADNSSIYIGQSSKLVKINTRMTSNIFSAAAFNYLLCVNIFPTLILYVVTGTATILAGNDSYGYQEGASALFSATICMSSLHSALIYSNIKIIYLAGVAYDSVSGSVLAADYTNSVLQLVSPDGKEGSRWVGKLAPPI